MAQSSLTQAEFEVLMDRLVRQGITPNPALKSAFYGHLYGAEFAPPPPPKPEAKPVSEELPREQFLLKLLRMTTSPNDGEALTAIRKVNELLTSNGWDWDKLIAGKIKIVPNPFVGLGTPIRKEPAPYKEPTPSYNPRPTPPPPPRAKYHGLKVSGLGPNKFADHCYCCGIEVVANAGMFFCREDYNFNAGRINARSKFSVVCASCEGQKLIWDQPAQPIRKRGKASINDLA